MYSLNYKWFDITLDFILCWSNFNIEKLHNVFINKPKIF